jgi:hypothetical protein
LIDRLHIKTDFVCGNIRCDRVKYLGLAGANKAKTQCQKAATKKWGTHKIPVLNKNVIMCFSSQYQRSGTKMPAAILPALYKFSATVTDLILYNGFFLQADKHDRTDY